MWQAMKTMGAAWQTRRVAMQQAVAARWRPIKVGLALGLAVLLLPLVQNFAVAATPPSPFPVTPGTPNTYDPTKTTKSVIHLPPAPPVSKASLPNNHTPIGHDPGVPMQPGSVALTPGKTTTFLGSDGMLELNVPATALTAADVANAGGAVTMQVTQLLGPSGSNAGGSGIASLGTYQVEFVNAKGARLPAPLHDQPVATLHVGKNFSMFDLDHVQVSFNAVTPFAATSPSAKAGVTAPLTETQGPFSVANATHDATHQTLSVAFPKPVSQAGPALATPSTSATMSWSAYVPVATYGAPEGAATDLSRGGLTMGVPIDVPPGPGGSLPNITLAYNSANVSEQHNPLATGSWVGEGWNLSLGKISWAERNVNANTTVQNPGQFLWEDTWELTDPFGTSAELLPPNINVSTFYDDASGNLGGNASTITNPITWHSAPETHAKIVSFSSGLNIGEATSPPCFRVWLTNGVIMV